MGVNLCVNGEFAPLAGSKIYHNGAWITIPDSAKLYLNSSWHRLGAASPEVVSYGLIVSGSNFTVNAGEHYVNAAILNNGVLHVSSGGIVEHAMTADSNYLCVYSGGTATVEWNPWRYNCISSETGAVVSYLERDADIYHINSEGAVTKYNDLIESLSITGTKERINVCSGGTANSISVISGANMIISGGTAINTVLSGYDSINQSSYLWLYSGGVALNTVIDHRASMYVCDNSLAENAVILGGSLNVYGGTANSITISSGYMYVDSVGSASGITVSSGGSLSLQGSSTASPVVVSAIIHSGGVMLLFSGASASNTTLLHGAGVRFYESGASGCLIGTFISSGGELSTKYGIVISTHVSSGGILECNGGSVSTVTVFSGGTMRVRDNNSASNVTVHPGGSLLIESRGYVGNLNSMYGAEVVSNYHF